MNFQIFTRAETNARDTRAVAARVRAVTAGVRAVARAMRAVTARVRAVAARVRAVAVDARVVARDCFTTPHRLFWVNPTAKDRDHDREAIIHDHSAPYSE